VLDFSSSGDAADGGGGGGVSGVGGPADAAALAAMLSREAVQVRRMRGGRQQHVDCTLEQRLHSTLYSVVIA
jgi:hypothetical protein